MKVPVLMYHAVESAGIAPPEDGRWESSYAVTAEAFRAQLDWLEGSRTRVVALGDLLAGRVGGGPAVVLTFDDGYASDVAVALPELRARGFPAALFVETGALGRAGRASVDGVRALAAAGMEIGSHTVTHRFLPRLPEAEARRELGDSKKCLEDLLGVPVRFLSLPGGRWDRRTLGLAREAGYEAVCTSRPGGTDAGRPGYLLKRLGIRRHTNLADFQRLVRLDPTRLARERLRYWALRGAKRLLGPTAYPRLRAVLVARHG